MLHQPKSLANAPLAALCALGLLCAAAPVSAAPTADGKTETNCNDKIDNDGDSLVDCFDADCYGKPECKSSGGPENTDQLCSDGVDNDDDGATDCEDLDCQRLGVTVCRGSWHGPLTGTGIKARGSGGKRARDPNAIPKLGKGMSVEDLIGTGQDKDGERNDYLCSDGIDNDGDGAVDCQDFGCRFDPAVTVCSSHMAGIRFSVVARINTTIDLEKDEGTRLDTRFTRLQLRAFGNIPGINNSFFLISIRAEASVRLTFATFEVPIWRNHRLNINSGSGGLSATPVIGAQKRLLLDPAYYLYSAFEGGNGASIEFNGPILPGLLDYRVMAFGGSGKFAGNVGGRFYKFDDANYTWAAGAQLGLHVFGRFDRFDSRFLYTQVPRSLSIYLGGRYDQRVAERFPAINLGVFYREWRFLFVGEGYFKRELEFESTQYSFNVQLGILVIPKWLMIAGDFGMFRAHDFKLSPTLSAELRDELKRINDERQLRVAAHLFFYRNVGVFSVMFRDRFVENYSFSGADRKERELRFAAQYRF